MSSATAIAVMAAARSQGIRARRIVAASYQTRDRGVMPLGSDGQMHARRGPPSPPPLAAQIARAITVIHAGPPLFVLLLCASLLVFRARPFGWVDLAWMLGALALLALVVSSVARMGKRRRWAWWGALVTNATATTAWVAGIVWLAIDTAQIEGTDPGMILVSGLVVGLPMIALSGATAVLLVLPPVWRYYLARG